jgi:hypothetical protein
VEPGVSPVTRQAIWRLSLIHVLGAVATVASWFAIGVAFTVVDIVSYSDCRPTAAQVHSYRALSIGFGLLAALVPLGVGIVIPRLCSRWAVQVTKMQSSWPWFAFAAIVAVWVVRSGLRMQPSGFAC